MSVVSVSGVFIPPPRYYNGEMITFKYYDHSIRRNRFLKGEVLDWRFIPPVGSGGPGGYGYEVGVQYPVRDRESMGNVIVFPSYIIGKS